MSVQLKRSLVLVCGALLTLVPACESQKPKYEGPYAAEVTEAIPMIEKAVGLKYKTPPKVETRSKEQVREFVTKQFTDSSAAHDIAGQEAAYKLFGMIPDSLKLQAFLTSLLEEQIVGYYDPHTKVLYVVDGAPKDMVGLTITHELVHALQDQYISLDSVQKVKDDNDRLSAAQSVFEGQAVYEQISIMLGGSNIAINLPGGWDRIREMIRENRGSQPVFAAAPRTIQETMIFPYLSGAEFYRNYKERKPGSIIYQDMPVSTEQIIHPAAFFLTRDAPTRVTLGTLSNATKVYENDLGEFETRLFLYQQLNDQNEAVRGATGWDGDRYAVVNTPQGQGIVWLTVWDSPVEAGEFFHIAGQAVEARYSTKAAKNSTDLVKKYSAAGRTVQVSTMEIQGRPVVIYMDIPAGANPNIINTAQVTLKE
ncbi:MAG TPA: hypothetical protein DGB72_04825 [Gemmatimonadetes bacterium]|jgi:hypothetical protein|nr:hypothetical protein [Gemmatimonadota bacterium]